METTLKSGQAFLCIKDVPYTTDNPLRKGKLSFTAGKLYYPYLNVYLRDNLGITKNYEWFKDSFERSPENDKVVVKKAFTGKGGTV